MPPPTQISTVYATDESIAIRASGDFAALCPDWQKLAAGTDGVFNISTPWVLTSASNDFGSVSVNNVIQLTAPKSAFRGGGEYLAVESVAPNTLTLRRLGQSASTGLPPGLGGVTSVAFTVATLYPQIEEASYDINRRFSIDPNIPYRSVHASRGKAIRAQPVASLYEQGRVHHVGVFPDLESQMCTWVPDAGMKSPDNLDALVWGATELVIDPSEVEQQVSFRMPYRISPI